MKRKSIFGRIFMFNLITLSVGLVISIVLQYTFVVQYANTERVNSLKESAKSVYGRIFMPLMPHMQNRTDFVMGYLENYTHSTGNYVLVVSADGTVLMSSYQDENGISPQFLKKEYYEDVMQGKGHTEIGTLGVYKAPMISIITPISVNGQILGAVVVSSSMPVISQRNKMVGRVFLMPMLFVVLISLVVSYILSRRIARPIKEIGEAAKLFSKGDFSERVAVYDKDEIGELAETFNNMADGLEELENTRRTFVSNVSHELRTPMTTITGFVDGILDGTIPEEKEKDYLEIVLSETKRLSRLVSDLLDISRIDEDKFNLEMIDFDINEIIRLCIIGFEKRINEKDILINVGFEEDECFVKADVDGIKRVLTNLIDNAVKFTDIGGQIDLFVRQKGTQTEVTVRNTGEGIAKDDMKNIFERFYKADKSRGLNKEGTGLGLYIVKNIINRHGGNIRANSVFGEYTEFIFTLNK